MTTRVRVACGPVLVFLGALCAVSCVGEPPEPPAPLTPAECAEQGGDVILNRGADAECPDDFTPLGPVAFGVEGAWCCVAPHLTLAECSERGGRAIADPGDGSSYRDGCPGGAALLGHLGIEFGDEGGICCEVPLISRQECAEDGGLLIGDPGDGSTWREGCPGAGELIGRVPLGIEGSVCCAGLDAAEAPEGPPVTTDG